MSPRGRPRKVTRPTRWCINLPEPLAREYEIIMTDPLTGLVRNGARAKLITYLLAETLDAIKEGRESFPVAPAREIITGGALP